MKRKDRSSIWFLWIIFSMGILLLAQEPFRIAAALQSYEQELQQQISSEILRFHILANSDSAEDQSQKLEVKAAVVEYMQPLLSASRSKEESVKILEQELYNIEEIAQKMVGERSVEVSVESDWFPQISYGECTFPEGVYDTLRIEIGKAEGHNWWCVLYPGLCFSNAVKPVVTENGKKMLEYVLDEACYDFLLHPKKIKLRWLGLEFFRDNR